MELHHQQTSNPNQTTYATANTSATSILLIVAGLGIGFTGILLDAAFGLQSILLLLGAIVLVVTGLAVPMMLR